MAAPKKRKKAAAKPKKPAKRKPAKTTKKKLTLAPQLENNSELVASEPYKAWRARLTK